VGRSARRERDAATLVLAGVTVTAFFTAWQTFVQQQHSETLQEVYSWILGNIPSTGWSDVMLILPYIAVATVVILAFRRVVDVVARTAISPGEVPLGVVTAFLGAPFFALVLRTMRGGGA